tara:strand:+ start:758 stop:1315 length:558 start_codon:yes stop_codon:yes gene_type:complete
MSELRTNRIVPLGGLPSGSSGGITQIKNTTKTDPWVHPGTYINYEQVTGLNVSITPTSTDNKILVTASVNFATSYWQGYGALYKKIASGTYSIVDGAVGGANSSAPRYSFTGLQYEGAVQARNQYHGTLTYLDSPNTTSEVTYSIALRGYSNSYAVYCNRNPDDRTSNDYHGRGASFITVMEVSG